MSVNKKMIEGKIAKKKLNDKELALMFKVPFMIPLKKNLLTRYSDKP